MAHFVTQLVVTHIVVTELVLYSRNTHHSAKRVQQACTKTLSDLQLTYLDLYLVSKPMHRSLQWRFSLKQLTNLGLCSYNVFVISCCIQIHWPVTGNVGKEVLPTIRETWQAMEDLVRKVSLVHSCVMTVKHNPEASQ